MMIAIRVLFLILIFTKFSYSQGIGEVVHPAPFFIDNLTWTTFTDNQTGYVTTSKRIFKTTNAGGNWSSIFSNSQYNLRRIYFVNRDTGFVTISKINYILRTMNGGLNWMEIWIGSYYYPYVGVSFLNNTTGFIAGGGEDRMDARITTNTGNTWSHLAHVNGFYDTFTDVWFTDSLNGFITGSNVLLRTTNGGLNFFTDPVAEDIWPNRINFVNPGLGYISYGGTGILMTSNGGNTWINREIPGAYSGGAMVFSNSNGAVYVGDRKFNIFKSTNYGTNWNLKSNTGNSGFNAFSFLTNTGYAVGGNGYMMKTTNYGENWVKIVEHHKLNSIKIKNGKKIVSGGEKGVIFLSDNFGANWSKLQTGYNFEINSISTDNFGQYFIAAGDSGNVLRSDTSGLIWNHIKLNTNENLNKVITTKSYVFIAGTNNNFFYSTDSGSTWIDCAPKNFPHLLFRGIHESNSVFYLAGDSGTVLRSTDQGKNWSNLEFPPDFPLNEIYFVNAHIGFVAGKPRYSNYRVNFYKTTNSGNSWDSASMQAPANDLDFKKIVFINESTGYMYATLHNNNYTNFYILYKTTDTGRTWSNKYFDFIIDIDFANYDTAFTVGSLGEIYRTTNAGSWGFVIADVKLLSQETPEDFLLQNYPNPFNPNTKIKFAVPRGGNVSIKVYDLSGKEITSLVNKNLHEGSYELDFSADDFSLSSGTYFVQLRMGDYQIVSKIVLLR
ncbi:MAG: T9SS type A sorting domain-containing protein [Ignavibacteria bacterium]|nr:T9SS type A sorting domain-containing protein [Ignavibacteria bacterium]